MKWTFCLFGFLTVNYCYAEILIITSAYNRPDFVEKQYNTFKKFLKDDYRFVVFCDAKKDRIRHKINKKCEELGIACIDVPQEIHDKPYLEREPGERFHKHSPAVRNCNVVHYALDTVGFNHNDIVVIIDSDMFLVREFSIREHLKNYHVSSWLRLCCNEEKNCKVKHPNKPSVYFMWIGLVFLDMRTMPNKRSISFNCGLINGIDVDAGGHTYDYMNQNKNLRGKFFNKVTFHDVLCEQCYQLPKPLPPCVHTSSNFLMNKGFDMHQVELFYNLPLAEPDIPIELLLDGTFIHYQAGSNYINFSPTFHKIKTQALENYLKHILS